MDDWFSRAYSDYLDGRLNKILSIESVSNDFVQWEDLGEPNQIPKVAQVKLNGGLGTSMGCDGPKSLIQCDSRGRTFIDVIVDMHERSSISSALVFLNSFNTSALTGAYLTNHYPNLDWFEVLQHPFQKIDLKTNRPFTGVDPFFYNPPGHGSVYYDLYHSGLLTQFVRQGLDYLFISNADNLAATCDPKIAAYMSRSGCPFLIELTPKRASDVKGGTVVSSNGQLTLWEIAQVDDSRLDLFQSQPVFNTNNIWVHIPTLIDVIESDALFLDLILNKKSKNGYDFVQLEYAMGSAIRSFSNAQAMIVPRSRFFPVKKTSDLLLLLSDLTYFNDDGDLVWNTEKMIHIQCHPPFDTVDGFLEHVKVIPSLNRIHSLSLQGNVTFNHFVTLMGDVEFVIDNGVSVDLPETITQIENAKFYNGHLIPN